MVRLSVNFSVHVYRNDIVLINDMNDYGLNDQHLDILAAYMHVYYV